MSYQCQLEHSIGSPLVTKLNPFPVPTDGHSFRDRVAAINLRTLIGDVFRSFELQSATNLAAFRMELECNWVVWFPQRLRRILETLVSTSILNSNQSRVSVYFRRLYVGYELRVTDNTKVGDSPICGTMRDETTAHRDRGLQVVRMLLEESDGELVIHGTKGHGTLSIAKLPIYCVGDFLESSV